MGLFKLSSRCNDEGAGGEMVKPDDGAPVVTLDEGATVDVAAA